MKEDIVDEVEGPIGRLEAGLLAAVGRLRKPGITLQEAAALMAPVPRRSVREALLRLEGKGKLIRVARARYFLPAAEPAAVACDAFSPSYVSFITVIHDAGFTEQIPRRLDLAYARHHTRRFLWQGLPMTWHPIPPTAFQGYRQRHSGILEATVAKAAADLVHRQKDFGGLTRHRAMLTKALEAASQTEFDEAANAYADRPSTLRRILFLRYPDGMVPSRFLQRFDEVDVHNPIELDIVRRSGGGVSGGILKVRERVDV